MVLAIIGILATVIVTSHSTFNKTILLSNAAYDVALTIRSAQTFGLGSRSTENNVPNAGYGVHFDANTPTTFTLFADVDAVNTNNCHGEPVNGPNSPDATPGNCAYTATELVRGFSLGNGMSISNFCVYNTGVPKVVCNKVTSATISTLDVVFARPNTQTFISTDTVYQKENIRACIALASPQGGGSYIYVEQTGAINVNGAACPTT